MIVILLLVTWTNQAIPEYWHNSIEAGRVEYDSIRVWDLTVRIRIDIVARYRGSWALQVKHIGLIQSLVEYFLQLMKVTWAQLPDKVRALAATMDYLYC